MNLNTHTIYTDTTELAQCMTEIDFSLAETIDDYEAWITAHSNLSGMYSACIHLISRDDSPDAIKLLEELDFLKDICFERAWMHKDI